MNTQFSQILSEIISNSELSKNEMIRNCDIDRSSFFKFLNGTRTPTPEQLNTICKKLLLTPDEERELREAYFYVTGGNKTITISNSIIDMMWALEKAENTKEQPFFFAGIFRARIIRFGDNRQRTSAYVFADCCDA